MPDAQLRILIFEEDDDHVRHLKKLLHGPGFEAVSESSLYQATRRFKNSPFDLSIVSLDMPDDEGEELVRWLLENYPRRQVILTGSEMQAEQEELLNSKSVIGFFPAPLPQQVLSGVLRQSDRGLRGQVQRMQVSDLLQALRYSQKALSLMFDDAILQQEAQVYMQNGDITHVEIYQRNAITRKRTLLGKGHEGFGLLMNFKNGTFSEQVWQDPPERTVMIPFDGLMMNAAQQRDESLWTDVENIRIRKALLIDNDAMSRMMLQQGLLAEGIDCQSLRAVDMLWEALEAQKSELLILDSSLPEAEIRETLTWLKADFPTCRVLFLGTPSWENEMPMPAHILPRPISPKRLKEILFELTQVGFRGFLNRIGVLDFLQLNLAAIDESKKLHIRDLSNRIDGQIFIDRGRFIHAEFGTLQGEDAFNRIAAIEKGDFFEDPSFHPPAQTLAEIMPHKLMIRAGRFAKPLEDPEPLPATQPVLETKPAVEAPVPVTPLPSGSHLEGVAAKLGEVAAVAEAGALNLFGEADLKDISLNLGTEAAPVAGGVTNLFGDDDEPVQIKLNLGGGADEAPASGGVTNLFGDDDEPVQIKLNLGNSLGEAPGGVTNLFGDDDEPVQIKLNLGGGADNAPAAGGVTNLFGDDDEPVQIKLNLGGGLGNSPPTSAPVPAVPAPPETPPVATSSGNRVDEMRARWAERRASMTSIIGGPSGTRTGATGSLASGVKPASTRPGALSAPRSAQTGTRPLGTAPRPQAAPDTKEIIPDPIPSVATTIVPDPVD